MLSGFYVQSKKQIEALSKGREIASKLPRSEKQREIGRAPKTQKQREAIRNNGINAFGKKPLMEKEKEV